MSRPRQTTSDHIRPLHECGLAHVGAGAACTAHENIADFGDCRALNMRLVWLCLDHANTNTNSDTNIQNIQTHLATYQALVAFNSFVQDVFGFNPSTAFNLVLSAHVNKIQNTIPLAEGKVNSCKTGAVPVPDQTPNIGTSGEGCNDDLRRSTPHLETLGRVVRLDLFRRAS